MQFVLKYIAYKWRYFKKGTFFYLLDNVLINFIFMQPPQCFMFVYIGENARRYFMIAWNIFDFIIVLLGIAEVTS